MCSKKKEESIKYVVKCSFSEIGAKIKSEILKQNFRFLFTKSCYNISIVNNITSIIILYFQYLSYYISKLLKPLYMLYQAS